jgi:hypothetical protein
MKKIASVKIVNAEDTYASSMSSNLALLRRPFTREASISKDRLKMLSIMIKSMRNSRDLTLI